MCQAVPACSVLCHIVAAAGVLERSQRRRGVKYSTAIRADQHDLNPVRSLRRPLRLLGQTLGRFDLPGQLKGIKAVQESCRRELARLERNRDARLRSYQTLGLCAGAALVILLV